MQTGRHDNAEDALFATYPNAPKNTRKPIKHDLFSYECLLGKKKIHLYGDNPEDVGSALGPVKGFVNASK